MVYGKGGIRGRILTRATMCYGSEADFTPELSNRAGQGAVVALWTR